MPEESGGVLGAEEDEVPEVLLCVESCVAADLEPRVRPHADAALLRKGEEMLWV